MSQSRASSPDLPSEGERRLRAQIGAQIKWAMTEDRTAATAPARRGFEATFFRDADPDGVLSEHDRAVRAEALRRAHFLRMALKSAQARRRRGRGLPTAEPPEPDAA